MKKFKDNSGYVFTSGFNVVVSAGCKTYFSQPKDGNAIETGKMLFLFKGTKLIGGWIDNAFDTAAETIKAISLESPEKFTVHFSGDDKEEAKRLWDETRVVTDGIRNMLGPIPTI